MKPDIRQDADRQMIRAEAGEVVRHARIRSSGTARCDTIRFNVLSFVPSTRTALCGITAVPNGFTTDDVPDKVLGASVYVVDPVGCYFSEPSGELIGREGWARYMKPEYGHGGPGTAEGYEVPQWEVFALCCDPPACDQ